MPATRIVEYVMSCDRSSMGCQNSQCLAANRLLGRKRGRLPRIATNNSVPPLIIGFIPGLKGVSISRRTVAVRSVTSNERLGAIHVSQSLVKQNRPHSGFS